MDTKSASKKSDDWTKARTDKLKKIYPNMSNEEVAREMGMTIGAITARAFKMGLKKTEKYRERTNKANSAKTKGKLFRGKPDSSLPKSKEALMHVVRHPRGAEIRSIATGTVSYHNGITTHVPH